MLYTNLFENVLSNMYFELRKEKVSQILISIIFAKHQVQ